MEVIPSHLRLDSRKVPFFRVMEDPESALLQWKTIVTIFSLPNLYQGVPYSITLNEEDRFFFQDYIDRCSALAQNDAAWRGSSSSYSQDAGSNVLSEFDSLTDEEMQSWCLSFRKVYGKDEPGATFDSVVNQLNRVVRSQYNDADSTIFTENAVLPIRDSVSALRAENLDTLLSWYLHPGAKANKFRTGYMSMNPEELISLMFYGGYLHEGKKRDKFRQLKGSGSEFFTARHAFLSQTRAISLVYMSLGELLLVTARGQGLKRPLERDRHVRTVRFES